MHSAFDSMSKLDPTNLKSHCNELEHFKRAVQPMVLTVQMQLAEQLATPPPAPALIAASSNSTRTRDTEMEKSKAPTFSGKTIEYPEFKRGWKKVAGVYWSDSNQVDQIKYKVDSDTRRIINRCETMDDVWKVLDLEFAQEQEVINAVDEELGKLLQKDCSVEEYIVKLRNHLPNLE